MSGCYNHKTISIIVPVQIRRRRHDLQRRHARNAREGAAGRNGAQSWQPPGAGAVPLAMTEAGNTRTRVRRHPERARQDRESLVSILDEGLVCHLGFVDGGAPFVIPTMYARAGDVLYVHGAAA